MIQLDGKALSNKIKEELKEEVATLEKKNIRPPHLAVILVGNNKASKTYVNSKVKACGYIGFKSSLLEFDTSITETQLLEEVNKLNQNDDVDGFIVQLPLPDHIDEDKVIEAVDPQKDVDGFHPINIGRMVLGLPTLISATPQGIMDIIEHYEIETEGKHCVVIGRSNIVGTPISILMSRKAYPGNCTVTLVHSQTPNIGGICQQADIIIAAIGKAGFVTERMVEKGTVIIDVGINAIDDPSAKRGYRLVGDVDFEKVAPKCEYITPVPGGVGAMTIAALLQNTMKAAKMRRGF